MSLKVGLTGVIGLSCKQMYFVSNKCEGRILEFQFPNDRIRLIKCVSGVLQI